MLLPVDENSPISTVSHDVLDDPILRFLLPVV